MNANDTQLRHLMNSGLTRWRLMVYIDAVIVYIAESGRKERSPRVSTRFSLVVDNDRADTGQGRPKASRETKFSGANGDRETLIFPI